MYCRRVRRSPGRRTANVSFTYWKIQMLKKLKVSSWAAEEDWEAEGEDVEVEVIL